MPKVVLYNLKRKKVGEIELSDTVFGAEVNEGLIYEVLKAQLASRRAGSAKTKVRSEVAGSSRKLYRQKGTGRARHGSVRASILRGGGKAHGPQPRSYAYRPPRKMRLGALRSALSLKLKQGELTVVEAFELAEIKTKQLSEILQKLQVQDGSLIVESDDNQKLKLSARNLPTHQVLPPQGLNLYDLLRHKHLVLTKQALPALEARLQSARGPAVDGAAAEASA
jgi:large subunit ribosomal protein L4